MWPCSWAQSSLIDLGGSQWISTLVECVAGLKSDLELLEAYFRVTRALNDSFCSFGVRHLSSNSDSLVKIKSSFIVKISLPVFERISDVHDVL